MDLVADNLGYDVWEIEDIPKTASIIWILGKSYKYEELEQIRDKINSILWVTYRKGFPPLGTSSYQQYTSDKGRKCVKIVLIDDSSILLLTKINLLGFGCMIRCGQMLLAEALKRVHLSRDWIWTRDTQDEAYMKIVNCFEDSRAAPFGIHQISSMGQDSGKKISDWFSPNEISQVLK